MDKYKYNDDDTLTQYVWNNYQHLFTRLEQLGVKAILVEEKASNASNLKIAKLLRDKWGDENDPEVLASLSNGVDIFRQRVRDRVLNEHTDQVFINRCPNCERIVRTPRAKQCLWCSHSWHEAV